MAKNVSLSDISLMFYEHKKKTKKKLMFRELFPFMIDINITTSFLWKHITKHVVYCTQNNIEKKQTWLEFLFN